MRRLTLAAAIVAIAGFVVVAANPAGAVNDIVIPLATEDLRGDPGDVFEVASVDVDPALVGRTCLAELEVINNGSIHPENDLIIETNGQSYFIENFETVPGSTQLEEGDITMGETVVASVRLGDNGRSSGALTLRFHCEDPPETTTTVVETTTTVSVESSTTVQQTTTTVPTEVAPQTTVPPTTSVPEAEPEPPTEAEPDFTG